VRLPSIDVALVQALVADQFPRWADLPVRPVDVGGVDNRTFRLGAELSVRLPSAPGYRFQVDKEQRWLPDLAPQLPLPIPVPVAKGAPGRGYPFGWSVYRWLPGEPANVAAPRDLTRFANAVAGFLAALHRVDATGGPAAGPDNFFRGGALSAYDEETRRAIEVLGGEVDQAAVTRMWETALSTAWTGDPVWVHGDIAVGNLLVIDGALAAVIDFGSSAVGDPACDLAIAWTLFSGSSRAAFEAALPLDQGTWDRGRGWTLWKALISLAPYAGSETGEAAEPRRVLRELLS
jgi:aminoglycoside phosphotransferase (APT) family kinase protein